jgi:hypothetical protein
MILLMDFFSKIFQKKLRIPKSILSDASNKLMLKSYFLSCTLVTNSGNLIPVTET